MRERGTGKESAKRKKKGKLFCWNSKTQLAPGKKSFRGGRGDQTPKKKARGRVAPLGGGGKCSRAVCYEKRRCRGTSKKNRGDKKEESAVP